MLAKKGSLSRVLTAGFVFASLLGGQTIHAAEPKTKAQKVADESWAKIRNFDFKNMDDFVSQECYQDEKTFASCLMAIDAVSSKGEITTDGEIRENDIKVKNVLFKSGPFSIVEIEGSIQTPTRYKKLKPKDAAAAMAKDHRKAFEQFFVLNRELKTLLNFARTEARKAGKTEAELTAAFISAFNQQQDPYFSITTTAIIQEQQKGQGSDGLMLGLRFGLKDKKPFVESVILDSPAFFAGFRQGDRILTADGKSVENSSPQEIVEMVSKKADWTFEVQRNLQRVKLKATRKMVHFDTLNSSILQNKGKSYLTLRYSTFMDGNSCQKISQAIVDAEAVTNLDGIILDLRDNGGGRVDQAVCIASLFLSKYEEVTTLKKFSGGDEVAQTLSDYELSQVPAKRTNLPLAVLINGSSASASELLSGALRDYKRAWLIGDRTYGKGSVMSVMPGFNGDVNLTMIATTGLFYQPDGTTNQMVGILPDFKVRKMPNSTDEDEQYSRNEDRVVGSLPASVNKAVQPKRASEAARIEKCIDHKGLLDKHALMYASKAQGDYQMLYAMEVLRCN